MRTRAHLLVSHSLTALTDDIHKPASSPEELLYHANRLHAYGKAVLHTLQMLGNEAVPRRHFARKTTAPIAPEEAESVVTTVEPAVSTGMVPLPQPEPQPAEKGGDESPVHNRSPPTVPAVSPLRGDEEEEEANDAAASAVQLEAAESVPSVQATQPRRRRRRRHGYDVIHSRPQKKRRC